ncbi:hypothetical protein BpHYR1_053686 [Brachionus plicatilis]|uniref:SH3 domain-containing protein n=1 Tax=Brachionus plicatilis TaxID=10195 RepID=A0A3M7SH20_BRAPC|nr:hypothetical protein BpHYR1_053686 [Brachionus plicatilis]
MDIKRRTFKTQKSKKSFQLPKCFQLTGLTKSLFSCKTTRNPNQDNYVIMDFTNKTSSTDLNTHPITSTMIEHQDSSNFEYHHRFQNTVPHEKNDYYVLYQDCESQPNFLNYGLDIEETRRLTPPVSSMTSYMTDYNDVTIVKDKSPISCEKNNYNDDSFEDYLQSTRISQENLNILSSSTIPDNLSPLPSNKQSTMLHSSISSVHSPSSALSVSSNYLEVTSQLESLILGLSSIYENDTDTRVCKENYEATFVDDVTVQFADTLTILKDNNDDWLYVEIHSDKRRGFIPKNIVSDVNTFIYELKQYQNRITRFSIIDSQNF